MGIYNISFMMVFKLAGQLLDFPVLLMNLLI